MKEIISSLDIGSDTIKLVVGEMFNNELNVLSVSEVKSKGVKRGIIVLQVFPVVVVAVVVAAVKKVIIKKKMIKV